MRTDEKFIGKQKKWESKHRLFTTSKRNLKRFGAVGYEIRSHFDFDEIYDYDTLKTGITLPVSLIYGEFEIKVDAKLDTGASHSIFARVHGENLGLEIESGEPLLVSTVRESFRVFGHELTMRFLDIEFYTKIYFAEDEFMRRSVLGRQGFLDRVKLGLIDYEGKFLLSTYEN